jgi:AMP nucleosidase
MTKSIRAPGSVATPAEAIASLEELHARAVASLRGALERFVAGGPAPTPAERAAFRYPELRVRYDDHGKRGVSRRAYSKFAEPGLYATTVTQPAHFAPYLSAELAALAAYPGVTMEVGVSSEEIPYPYVLQGGDELVLGDLSIADLARHFPVPNLAAVGDEVADGLWDFSGDAPRPLMLFDAGRTDYSLKRLVHYTGTDWRSVQPWILLTNYHRYVDQFVRHGVEMLAGDSAYVSLVAPGVTITRAEALGGAGADAAVLRVMSANWHRHQMPAYHLVRADGQGVTLVNIGVGPSNAKTITDHLAVLRPNAWLMIGHCGGLRRGQSIGDYVLAHAYFRRDNVLDEIVPTDIPIPALAEVQVAFQQAAAKVTGESGEALKARLRTGTVVTEDDRNWELRWSLSRRGINLSRAIAIDMESGTIAAQGYRFRVPYGTLLCVSDKPLHGEIKLPGAANAFYDRAVREHFMIGVAAVEFLKAAGSTIHSRKLRSFDEPPFR